VKPLKEGLASTADKFLLVVIGLLVEVPALIALVNVAVLASGKNTIPTTA
jgi:ACR3 family arsenite efflux pump ArsB